MCVCPVTPVAQTEESLVMWCVSLQIKIKISCSSCSLDPHTGEELTPGYTNGPMMIKALNEHYWCRFGSDYSVFGQ